MSLSAMSSQQDNEDERNERIDLFLRERRAQTEQAEDRTGKHKRMASAMYRQRITRPPGGPAREPRRRS